MQMPGWLSGCPLPSVPCGACMMGSTCRSGQCAGGVSLNPAGVVERYMQSSLLSSYDMHLNGLSVILVVLELCSTASLGPGREAAIVPCISTAVQRVILSDTRCACLQSRRGASRAQSFMFGDSLPDEDVLHSRTLGLLGGEFLA